MNIVKATRKYEDWLSRRLEIVKPDLRLKHKRMKEEIFPFLRATYYRWAQTWTKVCPELAKAPHVLAVGDLHVENFGTWRDSEGRLIWGVNDFDEAYAMAYANDLVRLAVSAQLAAQAGQVAINEGDICDSILHGYQESIRAGGRAFVLSEQHVWLRQIAESELRDPVPFWKKINSLPTVKKEIPISAIDALEHLLPKENISYRIAHRVAGLGSLGRHRFVAIADWRGGQIAREAKAMAASACSWAQDDGRPAEIFYQTVISRAVRCMDPFVQLRGRWIVRRLAPHCSRIDLATLNAKNSELRLLHAMGWETANIHLGTPSARNRILQDLRKRKSKWLHAATDEMLKQVRGDWKDWKKDGWV